MPWKPVTLDDGTVIEEFHWELSLSEAAERIGMAYSTLAQAAREGRLEARRVGRGKGVWLTTLAAAREAVAKGRLRPRR